MRPPHQIDPKAFIADFYERLNADLLNDESDPAQIIDRYHVPEIIEIADGHRMDREKLIAHTRPVRKNRSMGRMRVHEAYAEGDGLAARYTLHVESSKRPLAIDVYFFGRFDPDGRLRSAHMLTRAHQDEPVRERPGQQEEASA